MPTSNPATLADFARKAKEQFDANLRSADRGDAAGSIYLGADQKPRMAVLFIPASLVGSTLAFLAAQASGPPVVHSFDTLAAGPAPEDN